MDTSTAHNIGILSTKIGSNYNHQNLPNANNHVEIGRNRIEPTQINKGQLNIIPAGLSAPLIYPQSSLGATPDTLPATSPHLEETQETFEVHPRLQAYGNENGKKSDASSYFQGDGRIRKFDSDTGESLKIYDVFYHDMNDQEFSDSLNESTMEKDSLEPEELDVDSLESNENVMFHHMSDIVKRDARQDDGSLYGDKNDDEQDDQDYKDNPQNVQTFIEIERVPTYLYGIHPARTPVLERRNRNRNSEEGHKVPDEKKHLEVGRGEVGSRSPEDKSEENSLESKGSTSEESSVTQIENNLGSSVEVRSDKDEEGSNKCPATTETPFNDGHSSSSIGEGKLMHLNESNHSTPDEKTGLSNHQLKTNECIENIISATNILKPNDSPHRTESPLDSNEGSMHHNETKFLVPGKKDDTSNDDSKTEEESGKKGKINQKADDVSPKKSKDISVLEDDAHLAEKSVIPMKINSELENLRSIEMEKPNLKEKELLDSINIDSLIDSEREILPECIEDTTSKLESTSFELENVKLHSASLGEKILSTEEKAQTDKIFSKSDQSEYDVKNSKEEVEKLPSETRDEDISSLTETLNYDGKTQIHIEKRSLAEIKHFPDDVVVKIEPVDHYEDFGEESVENQVSDNAAFVEDKMNTKLEKINKSEDNIYEAEQKKTESSSSPSNANLKEFSNGQTNHKPDASLSSEASEGETEKLLDHNQEVETQLQELQSLNDLLPGSNIKDIASESQLEPKKSKDTMNQKVSQHDDNNNLEDRDCRAKDKNSNELNVSSEIQDCKESTIEEEQKPSTYNKSLKGLRSPEELSTCSKSAEDKKSTFNASKSSKISELSKETKETIAEEGNRIPKVEKSFEESQSIGIEANGDFSEHHQQISKQKKTLSNSKSEETFDKISNEEELKTGVSSSDSLQKVGIDNVISQNSDDHKLLLTSGEDITHSIEEDEPKNSNINETNGKKEKDLSLDRKEPNAVSEPPVDFHSSENPIPNDNHGLMLNSEYASNEKGNKTNKKDINKINTEDKLAENAATGKDDSKEKSKNSLDPETIEQPSLLEKNAAEELKDKIQVENNGIESLEDKDKTLKLFDNKEFCTLENINGSNDQVKVLKLVDSDNMSHEAHETSTERPAEILKTEQESIKSLEISALGSKNKEANITFNIENPENIKFLKNVQSTEQNEDLSNFNPKPRKSSDRFEENPLENISKNDQDTSAISKKVAVLSSETVGSEYLKEEKLNEQTSLNDELLEIRTRSSDNSDTHQNIDLTGRKSDVKSEGLKNEKLDEGILTKTKQILEEKKLNEDISLEPKVKEPRPNSTKSDEKSKPIKKNEEAMEESQINSNNSEAVTENRIQNVVASNEDVLLELLPPPKNNHEDSNPSTDIVGCDGSSAETSADFSSIGKDLEFFEDTIKYLKNATEHLGGMGNVSDANKNSSDDSKDANVLHHSAVLIQSAFRGYQVRKDRKVVKALGLENEHQRKNDADKSQNERSLDHKESESEFNATDEKKANAALKIQSAYRGHKVRKDLKKIDEDKTKIQISGILPSSSEDKAKSSQSPSENVFGNILAKSQIPVAVIHPTKYLGSMEEGYLEKVSEMKTTNLPDTYENETGSPSKQPKSSPKSSVKASHKQKKASPKKTVLLTRQNPLEKKSNVNNDTAKEFKENPFIAPKKSIDKNDQTFIRDTLDQTLVLGNRKLTTKGYGNKSKSLKTKTPSTADLLERPKGSKNVKDQFERKGKSMSTNGRAQNQESFDLETIKKELLSTTFKSPPQSGRKKKIATKVRSGKQKSPVKHSKTTKISQISPSKINSLDSKEPKQAELPSAKPQFDKPDSASSTRHESDLSKTFTLELEQDKNLDQNLESEKKEEDNKTEKRTLSKTYTIRSSLNEVENLSPQLKTNDKSLENSSEDLEFNVQEKSALTIQKNFRGFRTRKNLKTTGSTGGVKRSTIGSYNEGNLETVTAALESALEGSSKKEENSSSVYDDTTIEDISREVEVKEDHSVGEMENKSSTAAQKRHEPALEKAATMIQKTYRGYQIMKRYKALKEKDSNVKTNQDPVEKITNKLGVEPEKVFTEKKIQQADEIINKELTNPNVEKSAITIQKTFRGYQSRKQLKSNKLDRSLKEDGKKQVKDFINADVSPKPQTPSPLSTCDNQNGGTMGIFESLQKSVEGYKSLIRDKAATTIQKHFRDYRVRKDMNRQGVRSGIAEVGDVIAKVKPPVHLDDIQNNVIKDEEEIKQAQEELGFNKSALNQEKGFKFTEGILKMGTEDVEQRRSNDLDKSAITIQKNFRGYRTRKNLKTKDSIGTDQNTKQKTISEKPSDGKISCLEIKKQGAFDSFDVEEYHNEALQKSATTIQKTFRGYKARKEFLNKKIYAKSNGDRQKNDQVERTISNPIFTEKQIEEPTEVHTEAKNSNKELGKPEVERNLEQITDTGNLVIVQQLAEDHSSTSKESQNIRNLDTSTDTASSEQVFESIHCESNNQKAATKSSSAGAVLENAASTIQKAYRDYQAKKNNPSSKSYSNGIKRKTTPKEVMENSDESSIFIGPDTSFDLSDVDSVETKSDKIDSSEAHTPVNNSEEGLASTFSINVNSEDKETDNECANTPLKLRLKRSLVEPTAPSLDEILKVEEPVSSSPKLKWFVGDDPIIPSDSNSSKCSSPSPPSSSSVDPLISDSSKLNGLSSIDACRENLNSNQQLTPSISSAVVSTSSLLLANNTEKHDKNTLNNNSGIVSANEEENLKKEENNLQIIDRSEELSNKLENEDEIAANVGKSIRKLSNGSESNAQVRSENDKENKEDESMEVVTDLCRNCADGIHEGGICSEDLIKTPKTVVTEIDPSDQIKQFVLMEELSHDQSPQENIESSEILSQRKEKLATATGVAVTVSDVNSQGSTEKLNSSNGCPAISLIPPSSEDDTFERESSHEVAEADVKNEKFAKGGHIEDIIEIKKEDKEDTEGNFEKFKEKESVRTEKETGNVAPTSNKTDEDISAESIDTELKINSKKDKNISPDKEITENVRASKEQVLDNHFNKTKTIELNSSLDKELLSKHSPDEIRQQNLNASELEENLEDAFKTRPGDEFKIEQKGFEDDFSNSKNIEKGYIENKMSTELEANAMSMEDEKIQNEESSEKRKNEVNLMSMEDEKIQNEESSEKRKNEDASQDLGDNKLKPLEGNEDSSEENSIKVKVLEGQITSKELDSNNLVEKKGRSSEQNIDKEANKKGSSDNNTENSANLELKALQCVANEDIKLSESTSSDIAKRIDKTDKKSNLQALQQNEEVVKEEREQGTKRSPRDETKTRYDIPSTLEDGSTAIARDGIFKNEVSMQDSQESKNDGIAKEDETNLGLETPGDRSITTLKKSKEHDQLQEDIEIAAKLIKSSFSDPQAKLFENDNKTKPINKEVLSLNKEMTLDPNECLKTNEEDHSEDKDQSHLEVEDQLEKLIENNLKLAEDIKNAVQVQDLPIANSLQEVVEEPCVKKVIPPTPYSASSDPDESELESTTTKTESTITTPGYDETSETDVLDIQLSKPDDALDAMTAKMREPEEMVARMRQRRASEHKISIDSVTDQQAVFEEPICEPIKPMQKIQKSSSTDVEDEFVLQKLQRGDTTRESSAQSESVVYGDSTSQLTESEDTFNENLELHSLHRMNITAGNRSTFKPSNHLLKSVTIDDTVKYIDPEKSTEESGSSFCMDDALSEDVRKKMMAYSVSEADSDYYDVGDQTNHPHDDFNISTVLDNFPSTDTDTTIVSAATKIQAGARGFLTRRRIRRASMGTKVSLNEEQNVSFGNDAIGESLDQLAEEEVGRRQFNRQTGFNSLPSALEHSDELLSPHGEDIQTVIVTSAKHSSIKIDKVAPSSENDVNDGLEKPEDDSSHVVSNLEATVARRLTLQRGDALRNDSTPDDENGNVKQVEAKNNPSSMGNLLVHESTMVESTTTTTTRTTTQRRNYSDAAVSNKKDKMKWYALRQNSMPVQIDSEVFRVLPKHMRKRIKSAEGEKPKRIRLPRD